MGKKEKLILLVLLIVGFFIANQFTEFFLWNAMLRNKSMLTFSLVCVLFWEVIRTAMGD